MAGCSLHLNQSALQGMGAITFSGSTQRHSTVLAHKHTHVCMYYVISYVRRHWLGACRSTSTLHVHVAFIIGRAASVQTLCLSKKEKDGTGCEKDLFFSFANTMHLPLGQPYCKLLRARPITPTVHLLQVASSCRMRLLGTLLKYDTYVRNALIADAAADSESYIHSMIDNVSLI